MRTPDEKHRRTPVERFRRILSAEQKKEDGVEAKKPPIGNLPQPKSASNTRAPEEALEKTLTHKPVSPEPPASRQGATQGSTNRFLPIFWTAASIISLAFNVILLIVLIFLLRGLGSLNGVSLGPGLLGGLYNNFELMDRAHIKSSIPVQTSIPLNLSIPVQTSTGITLAQPASIPGAHVKISTALFNIDAPADVTLPAGTSLNVVLNFNVPVQANVPVTLSVPVDIAMQDTELHPAIVGLQDTIRPLYCAFSPAALSLSGAPVCR